MAAANHKRKGLNNQRRTKYAAVAIGLLEADILTDGVIPFALPDNCVITAVIVNVTTVSGTGSATVDVLHGTDVIANEVAVTVEGAIKGTDIPGKDYQATGGDITIKAGSTTPADGALVCDLIIEYVQLDLVTGEYT